MSEIAKRPDEPIEGEVLEPKAGWTMRLAQQLRDAQADAVRNLPHWQHAIGDDICTVPGCEVCP